MAASAASCAHCGKEGVGFKRCSVCKETWYCGAACQNANWKRHKKTCAPPMPPTEVAKSIDAARAAEDWRGVLQWEGRMEELMSAGGNLGNRLTCELTCELMAHRSDANSEAILHAFSWAHKQGWNATDSKDHVRSFVRLEERRIPLLGNLQRFRDQGEAMCMLANVLFVIERGVEGRSWLERARDVGAAHGFFSVESSACMGLGVWVISEGRHEEGVALLRNALAAAELNELDNPEYEVDALDSLTDALFHTHAIDEVEPLMLRFREAAKAQSEKEGGFSFVELRSLLASARLHEARGRRQAAAGEVRAMLDFLRENETEARMLFTPCQNVLGQAGSLLKILDPEVGDTELIREVAEELAKLRRMAELSELQEGPEGA